ncbi:MAG TPA: sulfite exporter TauE/SafE family protein [Gammaproteobacteria bacterium]|nr:sulfite exporter TauE/SafE family protein [Gammaproteobacteria bacterium]
MDHLLLWQYGIIGLLFVWSGFVRSGLGFGGSVLSLPLMLLVINDPLVFLPLIAIQLLIFSSLTVGMDVRNVDWHYLKKAMAIMFVPKLVGILGLLTLPGSWLTIMVYTMTLFYALMYLLNLQLSRGNKLTDLVLLILGAYVSGISLIGAPLIVAAFVRHVAASQLRNTCFVLWFILVLFKVIAFAVAGVDFQFQQQLWLLPCAAAGHYLGLQVHRKLLGVDAVSFKRVIGAVLGLVSLFGLGQVLISY